MRILYTKITL